MRNISFDWKINTDYYDNIEYWYMVYIIDNIYLKLTKLKKVNYFVKYS